MKPTDRVQLGITHGGSTFVRLIFNNGDGMALGSLAPCDQVGFINRVIAEAVAAERERWKDWVPLPQDMSGFDDPDCDECTKECIRESCVMHGVECPEYLNPEAAK